jgi:MFS family permease
MVSQAFFYNAIFFTYALVLTRFYAIEPTRGRLYIFRSRGQRAGAAAAGPLFDRIGRRVMIAATYALSGSGLHSRPGLHGGVLDATQPDALLVGRVLPRIGGRELGLLTVSEVFPLEMRALAISIFYAVGTGVGGFCAPALFGALIETGDRANVFVGYAIGAALVVLAAAVAWRWAVDAECKPLEEVAPPLGADDLGPGMR